MTPWAKRILLLLRKKQKREPKYTIKIVNLDPKNAVLIEMQPGR